MTDNSCPICFTCKPLRVVCSNKHRVCEVCYGTILRENRVCLESSQTAEEAHANGVHPIPTINCPCPICRVPMNKLALRQGFWNVKCSDGNYISVLDSVPERGSAKEKWQIIDEILSLGYEISLDMLLQPTLTAMDRNGFRWNEED